MKNLLIFSWILVFILNTGFAQQEVIQTGAKVSDKRLCTPHPSKEAVALYNYLLDMKGKKILSGQQDSP